MTEHLDVTIKVLREKIEQCKARDQVQGTRIKMLEDLNHKRVRENELLARRVRELEEEKARWAPAFASGSIPKGTHELR